MQDFFKEIKEINLESALYIVATPIGNLSDITIRALNILDKSDFVVCEDSRVSAKLLNSYNIKDKKFISYNDHAGENVRNKIYGLLQEGKILSFISDAGTPLISDPGYKLVNFLRERNQKIIPIPGACSLTLAISASGIACDNFLFLGFLPNSRGQKEKIFKNLPKNYSFIFFESANRVIKSLKLLKEIFDERKCSVAKELTKIHEELICDNLEGLLKFFEENPGKLRGEFVIIVEKSQKDEKISQEELIEEIKNAFKAGYSIKDLSQNIAQIYGINKKEIYKMALDLI